MKLIYIDIKRSIVSLSYIIPVTIMILTISLGIGIESLFPEMNRYGLVHYYHANILLTALNADIVLMAIPILCTLPYTTAFLDEFNSGYIKTYLMKCDKANYIKGKVIAPAISGGLVLACGILVFYILSSLIYSPMEIADEYAISPFLEVMKKCILFFFCGALWGSVGALLSNISLSKYMAYASPFVIFYVLVILSERYFTDVYVINPKEWLCLDNQWVLNQWGSIIIMLILTIIVCMINAEVIERRINNV